MKRPPSLIQYHLPDNALAMLTEAGFRPLERGEYRAPGNWRLSLCVYGFIAADKSGTLYCYCARLIDADNVVHEQQRLPLEIAPLRAFLHEFGFPIDAVLRTKRLNALLAP